MIPNDSHETTRPPRMSDSEATRAAGIDWTSDNSVVLAVFPDAESWADYGEYPDPEEMFYIAGPEAQTDSGHSYVLSENERSQREAWKAARRHPTVVAYEAQHRPVRETTDDNSDWCPTCSALIVYKAGSSTSVCGHVERPTTNAVREDLMRDTTDAVSGEFCQCPASIPTHPTCVDCGRPYSFNPKPVAPDSGKDAFEAWLEGFRFRYQNGMEFTPVEKDIARHAWNGRAALESKPAPEGEVKVCVDCRDFEHNIRTWIEQLGGDASDEHISLTLETLIETVEETRKKGA